ADGPTGPPVRSALPGRTPAPVAGAVSLPAPPGAALAGSHLPEAPQSTPTEVAHLPGRDGGRPQGGHPEAGLAQILLRIEDLLRHHGRDRVPSGPAERTVYGFTSTNPYSSSR